MSTVSSVRGMAERQEATVEEVSVIIPTFHGDVTRVTASLTMQTYRDFVVHVVRGVSPASRARNQGIAEARGKYLLFLDDDAVLGHPEALERLIAALQAEPAVGVVGTAKILFPSATAFQRRVALEVPRWIYPVRTEDTESNPTLDRYGYTGITTTCCLVRREVITAVGGFEDELPTGPEDTEFFYRVRRAGYRFVIPADCWVYHNPPATLGALLRKGFAYGVGHAFEARRAPERGMAIVPLDRWYGLAFLLLSPFHFFPSLFIHYYFDPIRQLRLGFRPLKALSTYATLYGYAWGWWHFKPDREVARQTGLE